MAREKFDPENPTPTDKAEGMATVRAHVWHAFHALDTALDEGAIWLGAEYNDMRADLEDARGVLRAAVDRLDGK